MLRKLMKIAFYIFSFQKVEKLSIGLLPFLGILYGYISAQLKHGLCRGYPRLAHAYYKYSSVLYVFQIHVIHKRSLLYVHY